ncbi:MAG: ABC transporter permease [Oscillibacter sp.]|nr:ABC transporter permease [Oscillibacter sp.]
MRKFLVLAGVQLRSLLASFRIGGSRKRAVSGWAALALMAGLCLYVSGLYSFALGGQLAETGALELLLLLMPAMAVIAGLVFPAFAAQGVVYGGRDADLLLSMPVSAFTVLLAKLTALYAENLVFCVFLVLPAGAAWLWFGGGGGAILVLRLLIGIPFLTLLPTVLSLAAGFLLSWLGGRFANRRAVNLLLYAAMMVVLFFLAIRFNAGVTAIAAGTAGVEISGGFNIWGIPFLLFQRGVCGDWETLVMFCLLSLVPAALVAWLFARNYQQILTGLHSHGRRAAYRLGRLRASSRRRALLRKEAARFFGTPIYLFNAGFGLILLVVAGIAAVIMGGSLRAQLAGVEELPLLVLSAGVVAFFLSTAAITASSISLEGEKLWILKEAPVSAREALDVKAGFQLLLVCPCLLVGSAGLSWGLGLTFPEGIALFIFGLAFAGVTAPMGLTVNLLFPKLDAVNDMVVVKQSLASMLSTFGGMAAAVVCAMLVWQLSRITGELAALAGCTAVLIICGGVLYRWLHTRGAERFMNL